LFAKSPGNIFLLHDAKREHARIHDMSITFEDGIESQKAAWGAVFSMTLCVFVLIASEFMPVSLLTPIASGLSISEGQAGQAISISGVFAVITSLFIATLTRRLDRRIVVLGLTALLTLSGIIVTFAPTYPVLMIGRALLGISIGGFWSMSTAIVMRLVSESQVPEALALLNAGNAIAATISAPVGSLLGAYIGWTTGSKRFTHLGSSRCASSASNDNRPIQTGDFQMSKHIETQDRFDLSRRGLMKATGVAVAAMSLIPAVAATEALAQTTEWDKTFPKSDKVDHQKVSFKNRYGITLAGDLYLPKERGNGKLAAIVISGPFGAVKEQSSGLYAQTMAERGFATLAFDPSYTGESGGEPRNIARRTSTPRTSVPRWTSSACGRKSIANGSA
jgi:hypothetical protein